MVKAPLAMPFQITRRLPANLRYVALLFLAAVGFVTLTQSAALPPDFAAFIHSNIPSILLLVLGILVLPLLFSVRRQTLTINQQGVSLETNSRRYVYQWRDTREISNTNQGVRLSMGGQSTAQSVYNVIPARYFGIGQNNLNVLIQQGIDCWGTKEPDYSVWQFLHTRRRSPKGREISVCHGHAHDRRDVCNPFLIVGCPERSRIDR